MILVVWLLGAALGASAHEIYPIKPVRATLRLEPDRIVADIEADSIYWIEEVGHVKPMPTTDWPADTRARVEDYVNAHFRLSAGGRELKGRLSEGRYRQQPWEINEEGTFFLRLSYPAPPPGSTLSGTADFYADYRKELLTELAGRPLPYADGYRVFLEIPGRKIFRYTLTPDAPSFVVAVDEARRSALSMAKEGFARGAEAAASTAACFPLLLAAALCLGAQSLTRAFGAALLAASIAGGLAASTLNVPSWTPWAATLGASLAAGRLGRKTLHFFAAAAVGCLALVWADNCKPLLPHSALSAAAALAGALAAGACLLAAALFAVHAEHIRLRTVSESRVEDLFVRRLRLGGTTLAMIGAYGLWQSLPR